MSPAWRIILFAASPLSISSFKLMVIVLFKRGGSPGAGEFAEAVGTADAEDPDSCAAPGCGVPVETAAGAGTSRPIAGGSAGSAGVATAGRVTITVSPA